MDAVLRAVLAVVSEARAGAGAGGRWGAGPSVGTSGDGWARVVTGGHEWWRVGMSGSGWARVVAGGHEW